MSLIGRIKSLFGSSSSEPVDKESSYKNDELYDSGIIRIVGRDEEVRELREEHAKKYRQELQRASSTTTGTSRASPDRLRELAKE